MMRNKILRVLIPAALLAGGMLLIYVVAINWGLETVSYAFLLGFPMISGAIIMWFRPKGSFQTLGKSIAWLVGVLLLAILSSFVTGQEGLLCIAIAIVPLLFGTLAGGFIYFLAQRWRDDASDGLKIVAWPVLALALLSAVPTEPKTYEIANETVIDAPVGVVFEMLKSIPQISADEVPTHASHLLGIPKPTSAVWVEGPQGIVRHSNWGDDVHFHEVITEIVPDQLIAWDFAFPKGWVADGIEDPHIQVGGRYFSVVSGSYRLEPIGKQTRLILTTRTYDNSGLGTYAEFWHRFFFEDFHLAILHVVKSRAHAMHG